MESSNQNLQNLNLQELLSLVQSATRRLQESATAMQGVSESSVAHSVSAQSMSSQPGSSNAAVSPMTDNGLLGRGSYPNNSPQLGLGFRAAGSLFSGPSPSTSAWPGAPRYSTPVSTLTEMRQNFAPYPAPGNGRRTMARNRHVSPSPLPKSLQLNIFCLGGPSDTNSPSNERRTALVLQQLGPTIISIERDASPERLSASIIAAFPQLASCGFEMLRSSSSGFGRPLIRLQRCSPIPDISAILASRVQVIYVRPFSEITSTEAHVYSQEPNFPGNVNSNITIREAGGFQFDVAVPAGSQESQDTYATMTEYRDTLFLRNPGEQVINVRSREEFLEELMGIYKNPAFNYKQKTFVKFAGEPGRDIVGVTREFFSIGLQTIREGRLGNQAFFEGGLDYLVPTCHPSLLSAGVYRLCGKFMGHSAVHIGTGFIGFSKSLIKFIFSPGFDDVSLVCMQDVHDEDNQGALALMMRLTEQWAPNDEELKPLKAKLEAAGIYDTLNRQNIHLIAQQFLLQCAIYSRLPSLKDIRDGLMESGAFELLSKHEHLIDAAFPSASEVEISAHEIIAAVVYDGLGFERVKAAFENFLWRTNKKQRKDLIEAWTGFQLIPEGGLKINVVSAGSFAIHVCLQEIVIPLTANVEEELIRAITYGARGFGGV